MTVRTTKRVTTVAIFIVMLLALLSPIVAQETVNQNNADVDAGSAEESAGEAKTLASEFGLTTDQLTSVSTIKQLQKEADDRVISAEAELQGIQVQMLRASAKQDVVKEQLGTKMPKRLKQQLVRTTTNLTVAVALYQADFEAVEEVVSRNRRFSSLLSNYAEALDKRVAAEEKAKAEKLEKERAAKREEEDAVLALEQAKAREKRERDESIKRLLKRETELAELNLSSTRNHNEKLGKLTEENTQFEKQFADEKGQLLESREKIDSKPPMAAQKLADPLVGKIVRSRRDIRTKLLSAYEKLRDSRVMLKKHTSDLADARDQLDTEEGLEQSLGGSDIWNRRVAVAKAELELQEKLVDHQTKIHELLRSRRNILTEHHTYLEDSLQFVLGFTSNSGAAESYRLNDENVHDVFQAANIMYERVYAEAQRRSAQLTDISVSVSLFTWIGALLLRLIPVGLVLFFVPFLPGPLQRLYGYLINFRTFRRRPALTIKIFEVVYFLARPVLLWITLDYVASFVAQDVWLLSFLPDVVDALFTYIIVRDIVSVLFVPRSERDPQGEFNRDMKLSFQERSISVMELSTAQAKKLMRSVRVFVLFWILAGLVPAWTEALTGIGVLSRWTTFLARLGFGVVAFWTISKWRDEIGDLFVKLAEDRLPWAVKLVNEHRARPYGVIIIAFASIYVLFYEGAAFGRKYILQSELFKSARNFVFRKRIELQQREREEAAENAPEEAPLPDEYVSLFRDRELVDDQVFVDRGGYLKTLCDDFEEWKENGRMGSVALVAEEGMGRSSMIEAMLRDESIFEGYQIRRQGPKSKHVRRVEVLQHIAEVFGIKDSFTSSEKLIEKILELEPSVVILDDAHHFFMRRIGGFDGMDTLLEIVSLTDQKHWWLLSFNKYAWDYINRVKTRSHHFGDKILMKPWTEEELQRLIEFRNARVEFSLDFTSLVTRDLTENDEFLEVIKSAKGYFRYLHEYCGGNPRLGMLYWLRSLTLKGEDTLSVTLFRRPSTAEFDKFTDDHWFVLTALAQHGRLNPAEIGSVINSDPGFCTLAINYLEELGLVIVDPETMRAKLAPLYFRQVLRRLANNNFLYS